MRRRSAQAFLVAETDAIAPARGAAGGREIPTVDEIAVLEKLLAEKRAANQTGAQLSDTPIADAAALGKEPPMCEIKGPYKDRSKWRVRIVDTLTGKQMNRIYSTEEEAEKAIPTLQAQYRRPVGVPMAAALSAYEEKMQARGKRPRTIETAMSRLRSVLTTDPITGEIARKTAEMLWSAYRGRPTHSKRPPSTDTQIGTLKGVRAFWAFVLGNGWAKIDPWSGIEVEGIRRRGKRQLSEDQADLFHGTARRLADDGDEGAIAALLALYLGIRASELIDRVVGDIDARAGPS